MLCYQTKTAPGAAVLTRSRFDKADEMIRDRIVFGTNSSHIRQKLIKVGAELTPEKAIQTAQSLEYAQLQLRTIGGTIALLVEIHTIRRPGRQTGRTQKRMNR